jgi:uncharacterized membrane protein YgcG
MERFIGCPFISNSNQKNPMKMKEKIAVIVAALALAFTVSTRAQTTNAAPLVITPLSQTILAPATGTLSSAQVAALQAQLAAAGITFSGGQVRSIQIVLSPTLTGSAVAHYAVMFYPPTRTPTPTPTPTN